MGNIIIEYLVLIPMSVNDLVRVRVERDILSHRNNYSNPMGFLPYTSIAGCAYSGMPGTFSPPLGVSGFLWSQWCMRNHTFTHLLGGICRIVRLRNITSITLRLCLCHSKHGSNHMTQRYISIMNISHFRIQDMIGPIYYTVFGVYTANSMGDVIIKRHFYTHCLS